jgi:ABC-type Fe3+-siderophore transport system permease subunit
MTKPAVIFLRLGIVIQTSMAKVGTMSPYVAKSCVIALRSWTLEVLRHSEQSAKKVIRA